MELRRYMVKTVNPNVAVSSVIYEGPNSLEEWTFAQHDRTRSSWRFKNGVLYAVQSYPVGRFIDKLPDAANIELDIAWTRYPELTFAFFTDNIQNYYGNCYMLQMSGSSMHLYRCTRNGDQNSLGTVDIRRLRNMPAGRCKMNVLVDKAKKTIALMMDGAMVQQWVDAGGFAGAGKGILFQPQNQGNLRINRIRISAWDGKTAAAPGGGGSGGSGGEVKEDLIRFVNNDKISGALKSIEGGKAKLETSYATMDVPVERIAEIEMSSERAERARRFEQDIQVQFTEAGLVTLRLDALENGKIAGYSENFGKVSLPLEAFKLVRFNLYRQADSEEGKGDGGNPAGGGDDDGEVDVIE
jgi:hypothetical protein